MSIIAFLLLFVGGILASVANTIAGGGSMLTLPLLIFSGLSASVANGSNRIFMFVQAAAASVELWRQEPVPIKIAVLWTLPTLVSAVIGAYIATQIDSAQLKVGMGWLILTSLLAVAIKKVYPMGRRFFQAKMGARCIKHSDFVPFDAASASNLDAAAPLSADRETALASATLLAPVLALTETPKPSSASLTAWQTVLNLFILFALGIYGGLIQAGLGAVLMAVLHKQCRLPKHAAMTLKNVIIALYTLPVLLLFFWKGQIAWLPGVVLAAGALVGARLGALLAGKISMPILMAVLYVVMLLSGISLVIG